MKTVQHTIHVTTEGRGFTDITASVSEFVSKGGILAGICSIFVQHTSASLVIQENADPAVLRDLAAYMQKLAPESSAYEHDDEGPDDMPAHLRSALTRTSETIPIANGKLALGMWQAVYLWEHRVRAHRRAILVTLVG
jgi:secondary thiamine-phosphate synthase enzyme